MKHLLLTVLLLLLAVPAMGFEAISACGFGFLMQDNLTSQPAYYVGFGFPVVTKTDVGYVLKNETSYLYSDFTTNEIQAVRTYAINQKRVFSYASGAGSFYLQLGAGVWNVQDTDGDDQTYGAYMAGIGSSWKFVDLRAAFDVLQIDGPDLLYPNVGLSIVF